MLNREDKIIEVLTVTVKQYADGRLDYGELAKITLNNVRNWDTVLPRKKFKIVYEDKFHKTYVTHLEGFHLNFENVRKIAECAMRVSSNFARFTINEEMVVEER